MFTFEENAVKIAMAAGEWSVRHLVVVSDEPKGCGVSFDAQEKMGKCHPSMMVSLLRPGRVWARTESIHMKQPQNHRKTFPGKMLYKGFIKISVSVGSGFAENAFVNADLHMEDINQ